MCLENMIIWKNKSINLKLHESLKIFNILIKHCGHTFWSAGKKQNVKTQELPGQKTEE